MRLRLFKKKVTQHGPDYKGTAPRVAPPVRQTSAKPPGKPQIEKPTRRD